MHKLSVVIALCAIFAVALAAPELNEDQKAKVKVYFDECKTQEKITDDEVKKIKAKDLTDPSDNVKCFANCFFEKTGTLKDGEIQEKVVLEKLGSIIGEEKAKTLLEKCKGVTGTDKCDSAFKKYACFEASKADLGL